MKPTAALRRNLERVRRLCDRKKYREAFDAADKLRVQWPDNVEVLVLWANLLQLQDEDHGPPLAAARLALKRATELDGENPMPWIELGHFLFALDDDTPAAVRCFSKAAAL